MDSQNIQIQPMLMSIGSDAHQVQRVTCVADKAGDLEGKFFFFHEPNGAGHVIWIDTGTTVAPTIGGSWTLHKLTIDEGDTGAAIATKMATLVTTLATKFTAVASSKYCDITCVAVGYASPCRAPIDPANDPGFAYSMLTLGFAKTDAGYLEGDIEVSGMKAKTKDITAHSAGETPLGEIITGYEKPVLKFAFKESDPGSLERALILGGGHTITPEGADATKLRGWGPTNMGGQNPRVQVTLHPVALEAADKSEDVTFWLGSFSTDTLKWSGTDFTTIPVEVSIYPDYSKPKPLQYFAIGDVEAAGF